MATWLQRGGIQASTKKKQLADMRTHILPTMSGREFRNTHTRDLATLGNGTHRRTHPIALMPKPKDSAHDHPYMASWRFPPGNLAPTRRSAAKKERTRVKKGRQRFTDTFRTAICSPSSRVCKFCELPKVSGLEIVGKSTGTKPKDASSTVGSSQNLQTRPISPRHTPSRPM
jgi:hypothetical protein